jgi:protein required for attachment to host cells
MTDIKNFIIAPPNSFEFTREVSPIPTSESNKFLEPQENQLSPPMAHLLLILMTMRTGSGNYFRTHLTPKKRHRRWYLLANRTDAVLYEDLPQAPFSFVERFENKKGRLTEGQLDSDRPGTMNSSSSAGTIRHGMDSTFNKHETAAKLFAKRLADHLLREHRNQRYDELVISAEPHFLGYLRAAMAKEVRASVCFESHREYLEGSDQELRDEILRSMKVTK